MSTVITVFVRHSADCKYKGDEFCKRCQCRKHFRWTQNGEQLRKSAGTRSWTEAEVLKRRLEDELAGRAPALAPKTLADAIDLFITDKQLQGVTAGVRGKYTRELGRLRDFCEEKHVFTVEQLGRDTLTHYAATWETSYPSTATRNMVRARLRAFFRYCYEAKFIERIPPMTKVKIEEAPTMPLNAEEYTRLLAAAEKDPKAHALFQLMRWSGLAVRDALTLPRHELREGREYFLVTTKRQKTGTDVAVPIPRSVGEELLAVAGKDYIFWDGDSDIVKRWTKYVIAPMFKAAGLDEGVMRSHRLRDTFAVDLLEKGIPLEEVSKLLGHESIKTTEKHYAKWVKGRQDRLVSLVVGTWAK